MDTTCADDPLCHLKAVSNKPVLLNSLRRIFEGSSGPPKKNATSTDSSPKARFGLEPRKVLGLKGRPGATGPPP